TQRGSSAFSTRCPLALPTPTPSSDRDGDAGFCYSRDTQSWMCTMRPTPHIVVLAGLVTGFLGCSELPADPEFACNSQSDCLSGYVCMAVDGREYGICQLSSEPSDADMVGVDLSDVDGQVDVTNPEVTNPEVTDETDTADQMMSCPMDAADCGDGCVDVAANPQHCGTCGVVC